MKNDLLTQFLFATLFLGLFAASSPAQELESYIELLRSDIATEKMAMITEVMQFSEEEASAFWPVYRDYQFELEKIGDKYLVTIKEYAKNYDSLTEEMAKDLTERSIKVRKNRLDLQKDYFKKFSKLITPIRAARWLQLENQLGLLLELQLVSQIPFAVTPAGK
jgi:hypothetical protein